jgi:hypothetical protein
VKLEAGSSASRQTADQNCPNGLTSLSGGGLDLVLAGNSYYIVEFYLELDNSSGSSLTIQPGIEKSAGSDTIRWSGEGNRSDLNSNMYWVGQTLWSYSGSGQQYTTGTKGSLRMWALIATSATSTRNIYPVIQNNNVGNMVVKAMSWGRATLL